MPGLDFSHPLYLAGPAHLSWRGPVSSGEVRGTTGEVRGTTGEVWGTSGERHFLVTFSLLLH